MPRLLPFVLVAGFVSLGCFRAAPEPVAEGEARPDAPAPAPLVTTVEREVAVAPMPREAGERELTNEDIGLDPKIEVTLPDIERVDKVPPVTVPDPVGVPNLDVTPLAPPLGGKGVGVGELPGLGGDEPLPGNPFAGRTGAIKNKLIKQNGGNEESERAVALGLSWLAKQQNVDGSWEFDQGSHKEQKACSTGLALLPFLAAGQTHKDRNAKYQKTVAAAVAFLQKQCTVAGANAGRLSTDAYCNGIAALALIEAYAVTKDATLKPHAQAAINYIQKTQGPNGSWGYTASTNGDTSIVGWQVQALHAAQHAGLVVDTRAVAKVVKFLDTTAKGEKKSMYGYTDSAGAAPGTALTAVGLLSRASVDNWTAATPGMADGVAGLMKNGPPAQGAVKNLYYYYYATQVVFRYEGEQWTTWNEGPKQADGTRKGGMRDWLVSTQNKKAGDAVKQGSWDPEAGWLGQGCGRLGTTAVCVLQLEVYYRYLPTAKKALEK